MRELDQTTRAMEEAIQVYEAFKAGVAPSPTPHLLAAMQAASEERGQTHKALVRAALKFIS